MLGARLGVPTFDHHVKGEFLQRKVSLSHDICTGQDELHCQASAHDSFRMVTSRIMQDAASLIVPGGLTCIPNSFH